MAHAHISTAIINNISGRAAGGGAAGSARVVAARCCSETAVCVQGGCRALASQLLLLLLLPPPMLLRPLCWRVICTVAARRADRCNNAPRHICFRPAPNPLSVRLAGAPFSPRPSPRPVSSRRRDALATCRLLYPDDCVTSSLGCGDVLAICAHSSTARRRMERGSGEGRREGRGAVIRDEENCRGPFNRASDCGRTDGRTAPHTAVAATALRSPTGGNIIGAIEALHRARLGSAGQCR